MKIINQRGKWITKFKKIGIKLISMNLHTMHLCFVFLHIKNPLVWTHTYMDIIGSVTFL